MTLLSLIGSIGFSLGPAQLMWLLCPLWFPLWYIGYAFTPGGGRQESAWNELKWGLYCLLPVIGPVVWHCQN